MNEIYNKYPFIQILEKNNPNLNKYRDLDEYGNLLLQLEKQDGVWKDVTSIELAKIELEKSKKELRKLGV
jgi:hypothetical protein